MKHPKHAWRSTARRAGTVSLTAIASASMLLSGSPFALAASLAQGEDAPISTAAAVENATANSSSASTSTETEPWSDSIDSMLNSGSYTDGEVVAIVAPAAEGTAVNAVSVDDNAQAEPLTESLLDTADTEELSETSGDVYESAFDTALPDAALEGAQLMAAAENDGETEAVQASDVDVYTLLVKQSGMSTEQILRELADDDRVLWAEPNYSGTISDGSASTQATGSAAQALATKLDTNTATGDTGSTDNAEKTDKTDTVSGVTPSGTATVASADELADATDYQWGYNSNSSAFGALHKSAFTVKLDNWNNAQMQNSQGIVAVVDTGIDHDNPDLSGVMADMSAYVSKIGGDKWGCNSTGDDGGSEDVAGHGSHCAGIVASDWNSFGTSGAAYGAKLLSVRAADENGYFYNSSIISGFKYLEDAIDAGADIRVASNSWGGEGASHAIWLAAEALGRKGTAIVFASGNDTWDLDANTYTAKAIGTSDYAVIVDSAMMTGAKSAFSNWGKTTTDVFAPGSAILSTAISSGTHRTADFLPELLKNSSDRYFYEDFSDKSASKVEAWVGISQLDGGTVATKKVGEVDASKQGYDSATGALKVSAAELEKAAENTDGGGIMVSLKVPVSADTVGSITNASVAVSLDGGAADDAMSFSSLCLETVDANGNAIRTGGRAGLANLESGWNKMGVNVSESVKEKGTQLAVHTDADGNSYIWMHVLVSTMLLGDADGVLFDCVGLGSKLVPYVYYSGTSMATPAVSGLAAVASTQMSGYSSMDKSVRATELVKLLKSSVNTFDNQFSGLCTSNGMIDASKFASKSARMPQIGSAALADDEATVTIEGGEFGSTAGSVTFGGKTATVKSWSDTKVVIECPSDLVSGYLELVLTRADGKSCTHAETFVFTENVSKDEVPVFEETIEAPSEFDNYTYYNELAALDGSIYVFCGGEPETSEVDSDYPQSGSCIFKTVWRYDIASKSWSQAADLPCRLANVSRTLWNGKLLVMGAAASRDYGGFASKKLFSYDPATNAWTDLSDKVASDDVPYQASIVNAGGKLLLVGGNIVTKLPADAAEADKLDVFVDPTAYSQAAAIETQKSDKAMMTLSRNNVRSFDIETGKVKVIGSVSPRANVGFDNAKSDVQVAYCNNSLYVLGGASSDPMTASTVTDQGAFECVTLNADGTTTTKKLGAYETPQSKDTIGALPVALDNYKLRSTITGAKSGPVLSGVLAVSGFDELGMATSKLVQDDTYQLTGGSGAFASIGKRVNYTPTVYASTLAYRGKLYVLGHDFNGSFETVMRATDIETDELPGDVTSKGPEQSGKNDEQSGKNDEQSENTEKKSLVTKVTSTLPKTGDMAVAAAIACLVAGGAALAISRKVRE